MSSHSGRLAIWSSFSDPSLPLQASCTFLSPLCGLQHVVTTMEYDRKSAVSSFYGGRKSSGEVLHQDFPSASHFTNDLSHGRQDSRSSYYDPSGPTRASAELLNQQSAGYNTTTFPGGGRQEPVKGGYDEESAFRDEPFDIYADFNNEGPRYSRATFGMDDGYISIASTLR
jgi:hypothetical protein